MEKEEEIKLEVGRISRLEIQQQKENMNYELIEEMYFD